MGKKSSRDDDDVKKLKKLKKLLGEDKLRQELEKVSGIRERKNSKKKSRHSSEDEVWEEKKVESRNEDHSIQQNRDKRGDKLEWMYKGADDLVDSEDYLLGKKIDQAIVKKQKAETALKSEITSSSIDPAATTQVVDMANKLREDPLFLIKQQEINKKKDLLNNPVRMKQLQALLQKSKQSKKKKKKHKKKRNESSSESSSDSDNEEVKVQRRPGYGLVNSKKQHEERIPDSRYEERHRRSSPQQKPNNYHKDRDVHRHRSPVRQPHRSRSPVRQRHRSSRSPVRQQHKSRSPVRQRRRSRSPDRSHRRSRSRSPRNRKMDAKEMERRRAEMMADAKSWDEDRKKRVRRYREEDQAEMEAEKSKSRSAEFVQPMKLGASSVEDRIKRNIYNIQRTSVALNKNFAKR